MLLRELARIERLQREAGVKARSGHRRRGDAAERREAHALPIAWREDEHMRLLALAPVVPRIAASAGIGRRLDRPHATLTFDDGPHPEGTPAVLDALDETGTKAIFFLVGEQAERYPELVTEVERRGHEIGIHCYEHKVQARLSAAAVEHDMTRAIEVIGPRRFHRPPLGIYAPAGLRLARELELQPLLWSRWGKDWRKFTTPERIAARATRELSAGDVVLLHDADHYSSKGSWQRTVAALPEILAAVQPTGSGSGSSTAATAFSHEK